MHGLIENVVASIEALKAGDNEALTGAGVDMLGYDGVLFIAGALEGEALDFSIKVQQAAVAAFTNAADLAGTALAFSTTTTLKGLAAVDIYRPVERYVRAVVAVPNAEAATPTFCIALRYNAKTAPVSNSVAELHVSPAEGTA